jgi:hypothetical protein
MSLRYLNIIFSVDVLKLQKLNIPLRFPMYLVIPKCIKALIFYKLSRHSVRDTATSDISVFGYIDVIYSKKRSPDVRNIIPGTPCISLNTSIVPQFDAIHPVVYIDLHK